MCNMNGFLFIKEIHNALNLVEYEINILLNAASWAQAALMMFEYKVVTGAIRYCDMDAFLLGVSITHESTSSYYLKQCWSKNTLKRHPLSPFCFFLGY